jgi:Fuc2NAc and GlcNAc transferase
MDGIDGIAASEAACVSIGGATLAILLVGTSLVAPAAFVLASACLAFLCWNWPPARIFMGDVGSGFLGFSIAVLALAAAREQVVAPWCWLILGAAFFVDATVTLLRRLLRRERLYLAHRSHAYQKLAECYGHRAVTVGLIAINMVILFPASLLAAHWFSAAALVAVTAITVLAAICIRLGAGH